MISPDDFSVDQPMMVLRARGHKVSIGSGGPEIELDDRLDGVILEIQAINLPFIFVVASCPVRGRQHLLVDARKYDFIRIDQSFADHVINAIGKAAEGCGSDADEETHFK